MPTIVIGPDLISLVGFGKIKISTAFPSLRKTFGEDFIAKLKSFDNNLISTLDLKIFTSNSNYTRLSIL